MAANRSISTLTNLILFTGALLAGVCVAYWFFNQTFLTSANPNSEQQSFIVEKGWGLKKVAAELQAKGLLKNGFSLQALSMFKKGPDGKKMGDSTIFPGEYSIAGSMSPKEILSVLQDRKVVYHDLSIPEGFAIKEIAERMAKTSLCTKEEAINALQDSSVLAANSIPGNTIEGYLFPETYKFTRPDGAQAMVQKMLEEGRKQKTEDFERRALELKMTWHQVLTLASIIEKETGAAEERPLISSVFHNRLNIGMPLQTDPTVIYGIPNFDGNLTKVHLSTPGPYNTYLNTGLPPSPIASPGAAAIKAALYPVESEYLYFVSKNDGTHHFSASFKEHVNAVNKFQKGKAAIFEKKKKAKKKIKKVKKIVKKKTKPVASRPKGSNSKKLKRKKGPLTQLDF